LQLADRVRLIARLTTRAHERFFLPAAPAPVRTMPLKLWRLRGHGAIPMHALRLARSRLVIVVRRFPAACFRVFPHVLEALSHATGNGAAVRHTQPHTRLTRRWVRSPYLLWTVGPCGALWAHRPRSVAGRQSGGEMPAPVPEFSTPQVSAVQLGRRRRATRPHAKVA
jgi:hypothetical protein